MNREKFECQQCKELSMTYRETSDIAPYIETWECSCGHIQCFHVALKDKRYPVGNPKQSIDNLDEAKTMVVNNGVALEDDGETITVVAPSKKRTAGFDDFLADLGYDFIDRASKIDLAELAFVAGGGHALRQVRIDKDDISLLKKQAE